MRQLGQTLVLVLCMVALTCPVCDGQFFAPFGLGIPILPPLPFIAPFGLGFGGLRFGPFGLGLRGFIGKKRK
ncbi:hypothetical protein BV898_04315 [Hypsibius exemplaris]|uniref:Uncharacterized protein n=1 Tax=Hypsibius exemplaris TaxID=2072580 RepID=A0A1W0X2J2_HYPEX|nr:hypothetical protein BV898_04315 [Hypsibius exemplaris]